MPKYHKPPRWARAYDVAGSRRVAVGLPGRRPSHQARQLASTPHTAALPPGLWHVSDHAVNRLCAQPPEVIEVIHIRTGARFQLLRQPGGLLVGISAEDDAAHELLAAEGADPTLWARAQQWRTAAAAERVTP